MTIAVHIELGRGQGESIERYQALAVAIER